MSLKAGLGAVSLLGHNMTTLPKMQHLDAEAAMQLIALKAQARGAGFSDSILTSHRAEEAVPLRAAAPQVHREIKTGSVRLVDAAQLGD